MVKTVIGTYSGNLGNFFGFADLDGDGDRDLIFHEPLNIWNGYAYVRNTNRKFHYWNLENGVKVSQSSANDYTTWDALGNLRRNPVFVGDFNNDGNYSIVNHETPDINTAFLRAANSQTVMVNGTRWYDNYKVSDMDGDGDDDVVSINTSNNNMYLWKFQNGVGVGGHAIGSVSALGSNYTFVGAGDLDHDGDGDVLFQRNSDGALLGWKLNSNGNLVGSGGLSFDINLGTPSNATALGVDDLDDDGEDEILFRDTSNNEIFTLDIETKGQWKSSVLVSSHIPDFSWDLIDAGDFDGDGDDDILWKHSSGIVHAWEIENNTRINYYNLSPSLVSADWDLIGAGDFDGDGDDDLLWRHNQGLVHAWEMENNARVSGYDIYPHPVTDFSWHLIDAGDFDGDGDDDLLWQHNNGKVHVWEIENGVWNSSHDIHPSLVDRAVWDLAAAGDIDGDGDDDLIWHNKHNTVVHAWEIENGVWAKSYDLNSAASYPIWDLAGAGDFNADGVDDILWQYTDSGSSLAGQVNAWTMETNTTLI